LRIGTLTVDQSGTGRLQQVVESVRVQDVVGQAIAIYSQNGVPQSALPPNLDATADPLAGAARPGATSPATRTGGVADTTRQVPATDVGGSSANLANGSSGTSGNGAIAAGIIRLMSDRLPGEAGESSTGRGLPRPQAPVEEQGATPNGVPQNSAVPTNPAQR
jgi:hypothetical protein